MKNSSLHESGSGQNGNTEEHDKRTYPNGTRIRDPGDGKLKFILEPAMKDHRGSRAIALDGVNATPTLPAGEGDPVPIVQETE